MKTLKAFTTTTDINVFGIRAAQFANSMAGLSFKWDGERIVVTAEHKPGEERWVLPAIVATISWADE